MQGAALGFGKIHVIRVDPYEDILKELTRYIQEAGIQQAVMISGYGTMAAHHLHWVAHNRLPVEEIYESGEGGIEILSMDGLIVQGKPHVHIALSTPKGAYGGHLEEGCLAYVVCEIVIAELEGRPLRAEQVQVDLPGKGKGSLRRLLFD
jgi:predicted DNA-binding protein with PD1-like motif